MFEDWIKVGDVMVWDVDPEYACSMVVLRVVDELNMFVFEEETRSSSFHGIQHIKSDTILKRSTYSELGWRFL